MYFGVLCTLAGDGLCSHSAAVNSTSSSVLLWVINWRATGPAPNQSPCYSFAHKPGVGSSATPPGAVYVCNTPSSQASAVSCGAMAQLHRQRHSIEAGHG